MIKKFATFFKSSGLIYTSLILIVGLSLLWFLPFRGLEGQYYDNPEWKGEPLFSRRDRTISLDAIKERQDTLPQRNFSMTWSGWIRIDQAGNYTFATVSDDGSSLFVDDAMAVDNGGFHGAKKRAGTIFLSQGMHSIRINYFQGGGDYTLRILWTEPGKSETSIPSQHLYPRPFPFRGIGFLTRHLRIAYLLAWGFMMVVLVSRFIAREGGNTLQILKRYAQNVALALVTMVVMLICIESGMRLIIYLREQRQDLTILLKESQKADFPNNSQTYSLKGMVQASPYDGIVYELKPNLRGQFQGQPFITNSRGLRDFEYSYQKPDNTFRMVGLGDSVLLGWGVKMEDTSLKVLERKLNQLSSSMNYEVINFAVPGYNTAIETEVFIQKCLRYDPDLVIMRFFTNDYDLPYFMKLSQSYATLRKSYLFDFVYARYQILRKNQAKELMALLADEMTNLEESDRLDEEPNTPAEYRYMVGEKGAINAIKKLAQITAEHKIPLIVSILHTYPGLDPQYTYPSLQFRTKQLRVITQLSQENGFLCLDLYQYYMDYKESHPDEKYPNVFWVVPWKDVHPSVLAHNVEAEAFYDFFIKHQLIK